MKNTIIGVDPSVSSSIQDSHFNTEAASAALEDSASRNVTLSQDELNIREQETTSHIVNDITIPSLRMLLTQVLTTIDVAIPNKDQNRAVKRTIREDFDTAYLGILGRAYPECNYAGTEGRFALDPAPVKEGNTPLA
jgi:predicted outer membrane protein